MLKAKQSQFPSLKARRRCTSVRTSRHWYHSVNVEEQGSFTVIQNPMVIENLRGFALHGGNRKLHKYFIFAVMEEKVIRAVFDEKTITVYQAYRKEIAVPAVKAQKFVPPFKLDRMTWIKPSFLWMMYRCGWGQKEGQEHILAIKIKRKGWEWALKNSCLSHFDASVHESHEAWKESIKKAPVRIQWDPERDIYLEKLNYRSIQVGLSGEAVPKYVNEWIVSITDITQLCKKIHSLISGDIQQAINQIPKERLYPF